MKKATGIMSLVLAVTLLAGPAFALDVPGLKHHVTGNITSVDRDTNTFTVMDEKSQKSYTFNAKDAGMLRAITKGEHVRVSYSKKDNQLMATDITPKTASTAARNR